MSSEDEPEADPDEPDAEGEPSLADDLADAPEGGPSLADDLEAQDQPGLADDLEPEGGDEPLSADVDVDADDDPLAADLDEGAEGDEPLSPNVDVDTDALDEGDEGDEPLDAGGGGANPNIEVEADLDDDADAAAEGEVMDATDVDEPEEIDPDEWPTAIYALKTTINQEKTVMKMVKNKAEKNDVPIMAILAPSDLRGYILIESTDRPGLERITRNVPHARGMVDGETALNEVEHFLTPKPAVAGIAEGDIVELTSGPFKGERARVQRIDESSEEITVELFEAMVPIPVTVRGDHVRVLEKEEETDR